jgi:hypothetical protein
MHRSVLSRGLIQSFKHHIQSPILLPQARACFSPFSTTATISALLRAPSLEINYHSRPSGRELNDDDLKLNSQPVLQLWPHQIQCVETCLDALRKGESRIGVSYPNGTLSFLAKINFMPCSLALTRVSIDI